MWILSAPHFDSFTKFNVMIILALQAAVGILHPQADPSKLSVLEQEYEETVCTPFIPAARGYLVTLRLYKPGLFIC